MYSRKMMEERDMAFNNGYELRKFKQEWEKEKKLMREAGMDDDTINKMLEYDKAHYNSRRRYEEHRASEEFYWDCFSVEEDFEGNFDFMNQISDKDLYFALKKLKDAELQLLELYIVKNMLITEIARLQGKSKSTISEKINRIIQKMRK